MLSAPSIPHGIAASHRSINLIDSWYGRRHFVGFFDETFCLYPYPRGIDGKTCQVVGTRDRVVALFFTTEKSADGVSSRAGVGKVIGLRGRQIVVSSIIGAQENFGALRVIVFVIQMPDTIDSPIPFDGLAGIFAGESAVNHVV